jgi:hypothetical protein
MSNEEDYEEYAKEHELLPKWGNLVGRVLNYKPADSAGLKALKFAGLVTSPVWAGPPTLWAYGHDEIMYHPMPGLGGIPGRAQYAASRAIFGPKPAILTPRDRFPTPPRPARFSIAPKITPSPQPVRKMVLSPSRPAPPPFRGVSNNSFMNSMRVSNLSSRLSMSNIYKPPAALSTSMNLGSMKLTQGLGSVTPFRPFATNIGFGFSQKLTLGKI